MSWLAYEDMNEYSLIGLYMELKAQGESHRLDQVQAEMNRRGLSVVDGKIVRESKREREKVESD